jgi:hypothetical protein
VKNIGKPDAGKLHVRFDEGGQGETCSLLYRLVPSVQSGSLTVDKLVVK